MTQIGALVVKIDGKWTSAADAIAQGTMREEEAIERLLRLKAQQVLMEFVEDARDKGGVKLGRVELIYRWGGERYAFHIDPEEPK